ncbi:MAG: alcohol dehydrogenase [Cyanobacteria bacterium RYN_339]|nr:alcohol dehydrogenase [Cyanobacteria bacterium RYN_339]
MEAITFDVSPATFVAGKLLGKAWPGFYPSRGLRYRQDWPVPVPRGADWARVKVTQAGVCGSDLAAIYYKTSPALTPFTSFPSVLGHEIVGVVEEGPLAGERVVVEPFLTCASRGVAVACEACRTGAYCVCHHTAEGPMAPGMIMGACRDQGGGWGQHVIAHRSQLFQLPPGLTETDGVLVEPLSIGMHAVLRRPPAPGSHVLVIGGGMMAYAAIAALKMLGIDCRITLLAHLDYQQAAGLALGAHEAIRGTTDEVVALTGAKRHKPLLGRDVLVGGFDHIFDCVGSAASLQDALYFTRPRGTITLVGAPGVLSLDWTFVWARELTIVGTLGYGLEDWQGERLRTFDLTMRLMAGRSPDVRPLVTHTFPLSRYREAIEANLDRAGTRSIKTVFTP